METNNTNKPGVVSTIAGAMINSGAKAAKIKLIITVIVIVAISCFIAMLTFNPFGWKIGLNYDNTLKIEDTANIVEKVKAISEFTTSCYYEEYIIKSEKNENKEFQLLLGKTLETDNHREIVLTVKGSVRAGFNLSKLGVDDIVVHGDTIDVTLPAPEVFDVISNPSDYNIFVEEGKWSHEEIVELQSNGKAHTLNNALHSGILAKANTNGKEHITNLFKVFGFNVVNVAVEEIPVIEQSKINHQTIRDTLTTPSKDTLTKSVVCESVN